MFRETCNKEFHDTTIIVTVVDNGSVETVSFRWIAIIDAVWSDIYTLLTDIFELVEIVKFVSLDTIDQRILNFYEYLIVSHRPVNVYHCPSPESMIHRL